jgi:N-acetyl-gamma-glutamyl-phosphate reductase
MQHRELALLFPALKAELDALAETRRLLFIDLSGDFRLDSAERYARHNSEEHPCPQHLADFIYGLPELNRSAISAARWIASPGCFATAMCLALLPLSTFDGLGLMAISGSTGSSGSGIRPSAATHHPARAHDFRAYSVLKHRHLGEAELVMEGGGAKDFELSFVGHSAPLVRGIHVTLQCLLPEAYASRDIAALFRERYRGEPFVLTVERPPRVATVVGSNYAEIGIVQDGRHLAVLCALDNLGKGMAGQAIQNMNIALGIDETSGLAQAAVYP